MAKMKEQAKPTSRRWDNSHGTYLAGQAAIDGADACAIDLEQYWGAGRLRLLVDTELREKFDRQRFKFQAAIQHGDLETVRTEARRMTVAWWALDRAAKAAGALKSPTGAWEVTLKDGTVAVIYRYRGPVRTTGRDPDGRRVVYYSLEEIGLMLDNYREVVDTKLVFPGSAVTAIRQTIQDPLERIRDGYSLDETFEDPPGWS
jgi:hypothetical protein